MAAKVHRNDARRFVVGAVALAVMGAIAFLGVTVQGGGELPFKSYTYVKVAFDDAGMLKPGQDVTHDGVRIGTVRSLKYENGSAVVTLRLDGKVEVFADARAAIKNESALGRKQVGLEYGSDQAPLLGQGTIPTEQTKSVSSLDDIFSVLDEQTRADLQAGLGQLGGGLAGHGDDLNAALRRAPDLVQGLSDISTAAASDHADLPALLNSTSQLAGRFQNREKELASLLKNTDATLAAIAVDGGKPLEQSIEVLPETLRTARHGLAELNAPLDDLRVTVSRVRPGANALARSEADLRAFLVDSTKPLAKVPDVADQGDHAVRDLTAVMTDARPLVPQVAKALSGAAVLLRGLAPYATDAGRFFSEHDLLSGQIEPDKHFFSAMLVLPGLRNLSLPDPLAKTNPYPEPGYGAWRDNPATGGTR